MDRNYHIHTNIMSLNLESVTSEKDIGVTFNSKLEFDLHINEKIINEKKMVDDDSGTKPVKDFECIGSKQRFCEPIIFFSVSFSVFVQ